MAPEYCETRGEMCDPTNCPREFCSWRDTKWALNRMDKWMSSGASTDWLLKLAESKKQPQKKKGKS